MIEQLRAELQHVQDDVSDTNIKNASLAGGLVKALIECRLEILKTTQELIRQRLLAEESGVSLTVQIPATIPQPQVAASIVKEIETQQDLLHAARADASRFVGGLVHAMKLSTIATQEQSLAMLHQRYLIAKYGLSCPSVIAKVGAQDASNVASRETPTAVSGSQGGMASHPAVPILKARLLKKQFTKQNYQDYIFFDIEFTAPGLTRPARAIKGALHLQDLFGQTKMTIEWVIEKPPNPGGTLLEKGKGFQYNQFMQLHQWVHGTALEDMAATFEVRSILYQDGGREDLS